MKLRNMIRVINTSAKVPARGAPGWQRPDVQPTEYVMPKEQYTGQQIMMTFFDGVMSQFIFSNDEEYQGQLLDAIPNSLSVLGFIIGSSAFLATFLYFANPLSKTQSVNPLVHQKRMNTFEHSKSKKVLQNMIQNPFKIEIKPEIHFNLADTQQTQFSKSLQKDANLINQINKQRQAYWQKLKSNAQMKYQH